MISNPKNGWCSFKLGDFKGSPSYLTDVPIDLLNEFIDYHTKGYGMVWFDEEGHEFTLVLNPYSVFIIEEKESPILHYLPNTRAMDLEEELISDIESDLNGWAYFVTDDDEEEIKMHRDEIRQKVAILRKEMERMHGKLQDDFQR